MSKMPKKAFILAAGKGTRLRPYTDTIPKPMVEIAGKSIIRRTLEKLSNAGVNNVVVNLYHLGDVMEAHLKDITTPAITLSQETELLETGGGIKKALVHFGDDPFYIINGDALWTDGPIDAFTRLVQQWDTQKMDILLFLLPKENAHITEFVGDYDLLPDGRAIRSKTKTGNYMFAGIRIAKPQIFRESPDGAFSFLSLMDQAEENGTLYGMAHDARWYHISTPEDLERVNAEYKDKNIA